MSLKFLPIRFFRKRLLIVGTGALARAITTEIDASWNLHCFVVGWVADDDERVTPERFAELKPVLGSLEMLEKVVETCRPDAIVIAMQTPLQCIPVRVLLQSCMQGIAVEDGDTLYERLTGKLSLERTAPHALMVSNVFTASKGQRCLRHLLSVVIALAGLILTAPLMVILALAIKLDSDGSALFIQERVGQAGRRFQLLKFRTMYASNADEPEPVWSRDVATRVTPLGKWLRKLYLDELPQLINILRGDMDMVGPRPEMASNIEAMTAQIPYYNLRHAIRPGLTGWAQIKQGYAVSQEEVLEKTRYDLFYLKHMSVGFDLCILLRTVKLVLTCQGS